MNETMKPRSAGRRKGTGSLYKQPGCKTYTIKYYRSGKCIREATGMTDYQAARQKLNQRLNEITNGTFAGPEMERTRVEQLAEDFLRDYRINGRKTYGHAEARWRRHLQPFFGVLRAMDVSSALIASYVDARMQEGAENATVNRELAALKRMFRLGYYSTPPKVFRMPAFPRLQENNVRKGFLEDGQYRRLVEGSELWFRALVECGRTYGWRVGELLHMQVSQVDLAERVIRLEPGTTKNRDGREAPMTDAVFTLLSACVLGKSPEQYVFTRQNGTPVREFRHTWANACEHAGVPNLLFHDLRRTAARNFRRAGVAEGVIMRVGGWKTRSVFERYNIVSQSDVGDALQKLERHQRQAENAKEQSALAFGHDFGHDRGVLHRTSKIAKVN